MFSSKEMKVNTATRTISQPSDLPFHCGMNLGFKAPRGFFSSQEAVAIPERLSALGVNRVALIVSVYMDDYASTTVYSDFTETPSDQEVQTFIARLHESGLRVMLKPFLVFKDSLWQGVFSPPIGRTQITEGVVVPYREKWVASFRAMLLHYAELAASCGVESICVGNEYSGIEGFNAEWREILSSMRERFSGLLTSDFVEGPLRQRQHDPTIGEWWHDLDFLCLSFYPAFPKADATIDEIVTSLQPRVQQLRDLCAAFRKPLVFGECGMRSTGFDVAGTAGFHTEGRYDGDIQGRYLEGIFAAFHREPWWRGLIWWKWDEHQQRPNFFTDPAGPQTFTIEGKPSAETLGRLYRQYAAQESDPCSNLG